MTYEREELDDALQSLIASETSTVEQKVMIAYAHGLLRGVMLTCPSADDASEEVLDELIDSAEAILKLREHTRLQ